jgi:PAS domain S-box-containing protein
MRRGGRHADDVGSAPQPATAGIAMTDKQAPSPAERAPGGDKQTSPVLNLDAVPSPGVLVVDDDSRTLYAMAEVLRDDAHRVVLAQSGEEALKHLLTEDFAVVLLDMRMPGLNGYETAALIRSRERSRATPIIFLTAFDKDEVHVFEGYRTGAVDYLFKPINPDVLKAKVAVFCELHRKTAAAERNAEAARQLYEAWRRREEEQSLILKWLPIALYRLPLAEGFEAPRFVRGNVERLTGFPPDRFVNDGKFWAARIHDADREQTLRQFAGIAQAGFVTAEYRWQRADGTYRHLLDQAVLVRNDSGQSEIFGLWLDIAERKQLEQKLHHAQRLEALGLLTGGIAHDFGNLLTAIMGSLDRLEGIAAAHPELGANVAAALRAAERGATLVEQLLAFSRQRVLQPKSVALAPHLRGLTDLLRGALHGSIAIEFDLPADLWPVHVDPGELDLALLNIATNARDAMPEGGVLRIAARNTTLSGDRADGLAGDFVALTIRDGGAGIAPEILERIFDPFFTTKPAGKGSGLGLSQVYGFAKQSGGAVEIDSGVGQGTGVTIYLPRSAPDRA